MSYPKRIVPHYSHADVLGPAFAHRHAQGVCGPTHNGLVTEIEVYSQVEEEFFSKPHPRHVRVV
jgi:hypothetical protein